LLDTHVLIRWRSGSGKLTPRQREALEDCERLGHPLGISAITLWELAKLTERGRLDARQPLQAWLSEVERHPLIRVYPITAEVAALSVSLGIDFHKDPADQIIVATARCFGLTLVTHDDRIESWGKVALL
jgi:PIN domain nuclease of toxin-antitoxin system